MPILELTSSMSPTTQKGGDGNQLMIVSANFADVSLAQYDTLLDTACFCFHFLLSDHHSTVVAPLNRRLRCFPEDFWEMLRGVKQKVIGGRVFSYWLPQRRYFDALPVYQVWKKKNLSVAIEPC